MKAISNKELQRCSVCGKMYLKDYNEYTYTPSVFKTRKKNS